MMHKQISHIRFQVLTLCLAAFLPAMPANGQSVVRSQDYFRDVVGLSETLGKAHSVRVVCNGRNDQYWRSYMQRLLELEAPYQGGLRRSMVNGFNAGFSTGSAIHRACDASTVAAEKNYATDGQTLTNRLAASNIPGGMQALELQDE